MITDVIVHMSGFEYFLFDIYIFWNYQNIFDMYKDNC